MEQSKTLLDEENEEILNRLDNSIGLSKNKEVIREIIKYHKVVTSKNSGIEPANYNIIVRNKSSYDLYKELINVIAEIYYKNKIIDEPNILYVTKEDFIEELAKKQDYDRIKEGLIVMKCKDFSVSRSENIERIKKIVENMKNKAFVILENEYREGEINAMYIDSFAWAMKIDKLSEDEKEKYVKQFMEDYNLVCDEEIVRKIAKDSYYKVKNKLLNILVDCKLNKSNKVSIEAKEETKEKEQMGKTGMEELDELIGLEAVKEELKKIINYIRVSKNRENLPMLHMCFNGNPGTGKTTVARIVGKILAEEQILSEKQKFVEAQRCDLIGEYIGQTAPRTQEMINDALGGVLFIDEAYSIASYIQDEAGRDYGAECIATLLKGMEDNRDKLCVILAGYTKEMEHMLSVNPGFESRIQFTLEFPDYTAEELYIIFKELCKKEKYKLASNIKKKLIMHFEEARKSENFSNARYVRSLFEKAKIEQANRVINSNEDKNLIKYSDIDKVLGKTKKENPPKKVIGFVA